MNEGRTIERFPTIFSQEAEEPESRPWGINLTNPSFFHPPSTPPHTALDTFQGLAWEHMGEGHGRGRKGGWRQPVIPRRKKWFTAACGEGSDSCLGWRTHAHTLAHRNTNTQKSFVCKLKKEHESEVSTCVWIGGKYLCTHRVLHAYRPVWATVNKRGKTSMQSWLNKSSNRSIPILYHKTNQYTVFLESV